MLARYACHVGESVGVAVLRVAAILGGEAEDLDVGLGRL
jgi:hypothetical protein